MQGQAPPEMTGLLALLLVMGLPWVETNVTITGRGESQPLGLSGCEEVAGWEACADPGRPLAFGHCHGPGGVGGLLMWGSQPQGQEVVAGPWCVPRSLLSSRWPCRPGDVRRAGKPGLALVGPLGLSGQETCWGATSSSSGRESRPRRQWATVWQSGCRAWGWQQAPKPQSLS